MLSDVNLTKSIKCILLIYNFKIISFVVGERESLKLASVTKGATYKKWRASQVHPARLVKREYRIKPGDVGPVGTPGLSSRRDFLTQMFKQT